MLTFKKAFILGALAVAIFASSNFQKADTKVSALSLVTGEKSFSSQGGDD